MTLLRETVFVCQFDNGEEEYVTANNAKEASKVVWEFVDDPIGVLSLVHVTNSNQTEEEFYA